jgi:hypothetical protein
MLINNKSFAVKVVIEESRKGMVELQETTLIMHNLIFNYYSILYNAHRNRAGPFDYSYFLLIYCE